MSKIKKIFRLIPPRIWHISGFVLVLALLIIISYQLAYAHKIFPGIKLAGHPVGNQSSSETQKNLEKLVGAALKNQGELTIINNGQEFSLNLNEINLNYKIKESVNQAYLFGRSSHGLKNWQNKIKAWKEGANLPLDYQLDWNLLQTKVASLAAQVSIPAIEPTIEINSQPSRITVNPGQSGRQLDQRSFNSILSQKIATLDFSPWSLPFLTISPALTEEEVAKITQEAKKLLEKKLILAWNGKTWALEEKELINFLSFSGGFDRFKISQYVLELTDSINQPPENATFQFEGGRVVEFRPAKDGQNLKQAETIQLIIDFLENPLPEKTINLPIAFTKPTVTTADVNDLGIKELVGLGESWFKGSIASRIHNLKLASSKLNGELIAPGEVFSFNQKIGDISEATGYKKAYIIKEGRTVLDDGGGVCQVSTTLFRAALAAGLPLLERQAHAYRVSYYEINAAVGLDATVYAPTADLKFKNDTPAHILIQTKFDPVNKKLSFELYGTADGRQTEISQSRIWEQTPPPPALYRDDPTLPPGTIKQIDWAAWGAKVAFDWKVTRGDKVLQERTFYSHYKPWQAIYLVGTKPN